MPNDHLPHIPRVSKAWKNLASETEDHHHFSWKGKYFANNISQDSILLQEKHPNEKSIAEEKKKKKKGQNHPPTIDRSKEVLSYPRKLNKTQLPAS